MHLRAAWQALWGQRLVPFQIQAEWVLYQQVFQEQLNHLSSYLARNAKAEKKRLARIQEELAEGPGTQIPMALDDRDARKAALRTKIAGGIVPNPAAPAAASPALSKESTS